MSTPEDALADRVTAVLRSFGATVAGFSVLPDALAQYISSLPPRFLYRDVLATPAQRAPAFVHELCHAFLHPPGSEATGEHEHPDEERAVHEAAARVCRETGVVGYRELMEGNGVCIDTPTPDDEPLIGRLVDEIGAVLMNPARAAAW